MEAYIVAAVRSPLGRRVGGLPEVHPADLGATVVAEAIHRAAVAPAMIDDVILGCVDQIGAQALNFGRTVALSAGLPEAVPGVTVDRQCGSSQQAVHFAAQAVASGSQDLVVAAGVEVMSLVPIACGADPALGFGQPHAGERWHARYKNQEISQFHGAELIAQKWGINRDALELFALESHQRAARACDEHRFDAEVVACADVAQDEGIRRDATIEGMAKLQPVREGGVITAAVASQISDGAAALVIASGSAVERHDLCPRARIVALEVIGADPVTMLTAPISATERFLDRNRLAVDDIDLFEVNEAFAPVVLAWEEEFGVDAERVNVNRGAIALGHPIGASGARLMTTLVHELRRAGFRRGLQTMCEGAGTANATVVELV